MYFSMTTALYTPVLSADTIPSRFAVDDFIREVSLPFYSQDKQILNQHKNSAFFKTQIFLAKKFGSYLHFCKLSVLMRKTLTVTVQ